MSKVHAFLFGTDPSKGTDKKLLGGKGAGLATMTAAGIPTPPGLTITTEACNLYQKTKAWPAGLSDTLSALLSELEAKLGKQFGGLENPLLLSVRSGAAISMPGMMDTVLNLGLNNTTVEALAKKTNNPRFAYDSYRRFMQMFGNVVMGIKGEKFEHCLQRVKDVHGRNLDLELTTEELQEVIAAYREMVLETVNREFPEDPREQLDLAITAVFDSWDNPHAITYRRINHIPDNLGTAVNVQCMVFGNMGETSGTGVAFTRDPSTGERVYYGEYLPNAQGEDVVAGIRTPFKLALLEKNMPGPYVQLVEVFKKLEEHYRDMQDIEFTIEEGKLWLLQCRVGKRTAAAAVKIACDMVDEGVISKDEALLRIDPKSLDQLLHPQLIPEAKEASEVVAVGLAASPGAAVGKVYFTAHDCEEAVARGEKVVLVRLETSPEDIQGMYVAQGVLTARGGMTAHASVVCRGMGKCCVAGCQEISLDEHNKMFTTHKGLVVKEGEVITLDGSTGEVFIGAIAVKDAQIGGDFGRIMAWADEARTMGVRANAESEGDVKTALKFGAEGIGLARTEHMFFEGERIWSVRKMIMADKLADRKAALEEILPMQKSDFEMIFDNFDKKPVNIRLLDPPLHEFLPAEEADKIEMAKRLNITVQQVEEKVEALHEINPMLGFRGCRLAVVYPEILEMQVRAMFEAGAACIKRGKVVNIECMVPLIQSAAEMKHLRKFIEAVIAQVEAETDIEVPHTIGCMIEIPRAAVRAAEIAKYADFYSFGTNDLTQMTFGFSRDDAGSFIKTYLDKGLFEYDPFQVLDFDGVGYLVELATKEGRKTNPKQKCGVCGETGGEPLSVEFYHNCGLNYVSCSPFRIPIARLAAAHAAIKEKLAKN
eukprot:TRINITY_DN2862_c1_g1_i1.p1 TRINITY_DN2862_c1_g1~~TRINITY_DN2862_c1_g1_i1.p1  ORF type:complete len:888 (-),score=271.45 TRINITY_DN2862_c1_g1_i1:55-2694(-)